MSSRSAASSTAQARQNANASSPSSSSAALALRCSAVAGSPQSGTRPRPAAAAEPAAAAGLRRLRGGVAGGDSSSRCHSRASAPGRVRVRVGHDWLRMHTREAAEGAAAGGSSWNGPGVADDSPPTAAARCGGPEGAASACPSAAAAARAKTGADRDGPTTSGRSSPPRRGWERAHSACGGGRIIGPGQWRRERLAAKKECKLSSCPRLAPARGAGRRPSTRPGPRVCTPRTRQPAGREVGT